MLSVGASAGCYWLLLRYWRGDSLALLASVVIAALLYVVIACRMGVICTEDVALLPKGDAIVRLLQRLHLISHRTERALLK